MNSPETPGEVANSQTEMLTPGSLRICLPIYARDSDPKWVSRKRGPHDQVITYFGIVLDAVCWGLGPDES